VTTTTPSAAAAVMKYFIALRPRKKSFFSIHIGIKTHEE
jgi:hypothetical protein